MTIKEIRIAKARPSKYFVVLLSFVIIGIIIFIQVRRKRVNRIRGL